MLGGGVVCSPEVAKGSAGRGEDDAFPVDEILPI